MGAADLAKTMGSDCAKDTLAGQIAGWVRGMAGKSDFAQKHPAIANAVTGGIDNAMQAFMESYADQAIDAAMGDTEAAKQMLTHENFLSALESGLSGGVSGTMGGAAGTGVRVVNAKAKQKVQNAMEARAQAAQEAAAEKAKTPSVTSGDSSFGEGALEGQTAVNDDPAAHTAAQNASIEEYKNSVDPEAEQTVENAGETVETARVNDYADLDLKVDPAGLDAADEGSGQMRETYGLREPSGQTARQSEVQRQLEQWGVESGKTKAAQDISQKLPANVDADRYAAAASTIYHLAQMDEVKSFDDALRLAGVMDNTALNVNYILDSGEGGRIALNAAYLYGADTKEQAGGYGGGLTDQSTSGQGRVYYEGTLDHDGTDMGSQIIELNAAATGTDAVLKNVLQNNPNVRAYVDSETARIFFGDSVSDIFGTVLHEDYHWYNSLDQAGAKSLQDHALTYLAQMDGYESVDEMIRDKMDVYASQKLTYEQAAEELVADAWRGIFATEADFKRWVEFQRGQAEKNAGVRGSIHKVMNRVKNLLSDIISRAKEVLTIDPSNAAALKAKRLAEAQRRTLQDEYFAHAEKAMDTLRATKENAAALKTESAAEGRSIRFSIQKDADGESYIKIDEDILNGVPQEDWKTVVKQAIKERYPNGFERNGWTILNSKDGRNEFVWSKYTKALQWENAEAYADKMRMASNLDEIIKTADEVYREPAHHKNAEAFNRGKIKVMVGPNAYEADVLTAIRADEREIFYDIVNVQPTKIEPFGGTHVESEDSRSRLPKGSIYQESADTVLKTEEGGERPNFPAKNSIAQENAESKGNSGPVKKSVRFQMNAPVEVDSQKDLVAVHNLTEENLREALELGGLPSPSIAVVKAQEGHTKYGPISLVFNSDTIDPMVNRANRIYGSDAWTPTRPNVEYAVNGKALTAFEKAIYNASEDAFEGKFVNSAALQRMDVGEVSSENRTELAQKLQRETAVQMAYLKEKGQTVEPIYKTERETFDSMGNDVLEKVVERAGADEIKNAFENGDFDLLDKMADKAADALEEKYTHGALAGQNKRWKMRIDKLRKENRGRLYGLIEHAYKMLTDTSAGKAMLDVEATREAIREAAPEAQVERWAYDKLGDVLGEKGIRNQKDRFTRSGKSRSFAELHNPYSPKTKTGTLESRAGWKGLCRKGVSLLVVLVACRLDAIIGSSFIRDATVIAFVCNETISIIENAGLMGVPVPKVLVEAVDVLRQRAEKAEKE